MFRFCFIIICFELVSCSSNSRSSENARNESPPSIENATKELFENNCSACHGSYGAAGIGNAANLQTSELTTDTIEKIITNGKKSMPAFKEILAPNEIQKLSEYVKTLRK